MRARTLLLALRIYSVDRLLLALKLTDQPLDPVTAGMLLALQKAGVVARLTSWTR